MAAILNYTTQIDAHKTVGEISSILVRHSAKKVSFDYDENENPVAITFQIFQADKPFLYVLSSKYKGVLKALIDQGAPKKLQTEEQAVRVSWRIIKDWVAAQMAIVQAEEKELQEVFLPYLVLQSGQTLYEAFKEGNNDLKLLGQ